MSELFTNGTVWALLGVALAVVLSGCGSAYGVGGWSGCGRCSYRGSE